MVTIKAPDLDTRATVVSDVRNGAGEAYSLDLAGKMPVARRRLPGGPQSANAGTVVGKQPRMASGSPVG